MVRDGAKNLIPNYTAATTAFGNSTSVAAPHQVNAASTAISVVGPVRSRINQPTTFSFALSVNAPGAGSPAGTVTLSSGAASCSVTVPTVTPGCALNFNMLGARTITAAEQRQFPGVEQQRPGQRADTGLCAQ